MRSKADAVSAIDRVAQTTKQHTEALMKALENTSDVSNCNLSPMLKKVTCGSLCLGPVSLVVTLSGKSEIGAPAMLLMYCAAICMHT